MRALLLELKASGRTIFINSHLLQEVELVCDRVAILDRGSMLRQGRISELTSQTESEVRFVVAGDERGLQAAVTDMQGADAPRPETRPLGPEQFELLLHAPDQATIDRVIDRLRQNGLSLISMSPTRQTLEEAFLGILKRARD